ncbi:MAG: glucokinase [Pseudobacteriovorax sp.]|nr:glucokinase [Pseudobacteriovorax sp.]
MNHYLVGDIGGTNARFGLSTIEGGEVFGIETFKGEDYPSLYDSVKTFLSKAQCTVLPKRACFAVASPILGDRVDFTNSSWSFSTSQLKSQLGLEKLKVINDFEAIACSIPFLTETDKFQIGGRAENLSKPLAILGPGTGLGMAGLIPYKNSFIPLPTEGGHAAFCPSTPREEAIKKVLEKKYGFVSNETLLSGSGLLLIYKTLSSLENHSPKAESNEELAELFASGNDVLALEAYQIFFGIMGSIAGDFALQTGAQGGVYIGGGIAPRYLDAIVNSDFRKRFESKGRFQSYVEDIACHIITAEQPGLIGASAVLDDEGDQY